MFARIIAALRSSFGNDASDRNDGERGRLERSDRHAPRRTGSAGETDAVRVRETTTFLCREAVLGRDERVAGYQFMLHEATRNRIRTRGRSIHHVYAEVLARTLADAELGRLFVHRLAFLDVPDSFLAHPALLELPAANTALVVSPLDEEGAPGEAALIAATARLREAGFRVGVHATAVKGIHAPLLAEADFVVVAASASEPEQLKSLVAWLRAARCEAPLLARGLPSDDDFQLCQALGATLFQGPFVTSRQDWHGNRLGPNTARLAELITRLRRDADTRELVALLKQDAALSLRLLRYINSAAVGLRQEITSIEQAVIQLGRDRLYRWLMLLLYGADKGSPRAAAGLENALVRARLMELLGEGRPAAVGDALYLVGLLSLADVVLQVPIADVIAALAPAPDIEAAVLRGAGPLGDCLRLAAACECGDPIGLREAADQCGITPALATRRHLEAFTWALELNS